MRNKILTVAALAAGTLFSAGALNAQASKTNGFLLNAHFTGASISGTGDDSDEVDGGGGVGVALGYGFNDRVTLFFNLDGMEVKPDDSDDESGLEEDEYTLGTGDLGLRVNFGHDGQRWRPYLNAAFTGVVAANGDVEDLSISGGGVTLGGGVQYFISRRFAVDGAVNVTAGSFTTVTLDGDDTDLEYGVGFSHSRLQLGLSWHP